MVWNYFYNFTIDLYNSKKFLVKIGKREYNRNIKKGAMKMEEEKKEIIEVETVQETGNSKIEEEKQTVSAKSDRKGFGIAAMVLGIVSLVFFCLWYISISCAILAVIFGILGVKSTGKGMAITGIVTGSIGLVVTIIIVIFAFVTGFIIGISDSLDDNNYYHRNYRNNRWYDYD